MPKLSHTALADLAEALVLLAIVAVLIAEHFAGAAFLSEGVASGLTGGLTTLASMLLWRIAARLFPRPPSAARPRARRDSKTIIRDRGVLLAMGLLLTACASSPEQREARRVHAIETAATLSTCAVDQGLGGCAPQLAVLVGCAVRSESSCAVPRRAWSMCLAAQATGCGLAALTAYVAGVADGPEVTMLDPCAVDAAEACVTWADQPEGLEICYARELVGCVE